eukprot:TRINITY_DN16966_c0_g1_i1.p1 TRINITY_DN16966_c0_g1~~TRINITY_DN16966_c0_g1_i1.p1  ORF type:complete len:333 (-),score=39.56 TRINITY_DN16966_c0_g1_i1:108-1106(-)
MGIQDDEDSKDRQDAQYDHLEGLDEAQDPAVPYQKPKAIAKLKLYLIVAVLIALGTGNFLLLKIVYSAYPAKYSFFVNQGINLGYVVFGVCVVLPRIYWTKEVTPEMRKYPQRPFFYMGVLDSLGTFFTAMGTYGTPGAATPLLNQTLIPFTMLASLCILKDVSYHRFEILGAVIIMAGAVLSVMNQVLHPDSGSGDGSDHSTHWYCVLFYLASNVPMACSANYKERNFGEVRTPCWQVIGCRLTLTCGTSPSGYQPISSSSRSCTSRSCAYLDLQATPQRSQCRRCWISCGMGVRASLRQTMSVRARTRWFCCWPTPVSYTHLTLPTKRIV